MFVSLRDARFSFFSLVLLEQTAESEREGEKREKANCQGCRSAVVVRLNQFEGKQSEGERKKSISRIFCLVQFSFPIPEQVAAVFQPLVCLEQP